MSDYNFLLDCTVPLNRNNYAKNEILLKQINKLTGDNFKNYNGNENHYGFDLKQSIPIPPVLLDYYYNKNIYKQEYFNIAKNKSPVNSINYTNYYVSNLYMAPGKFDLKSTTATSARQKLKRKYNINGNTSKKVRIISEITENGQLVMYQGRNTTYPDKLNKLIHPLKCNLCNTQMNSLNGAKDHYESKAHDKNITNWLNKNCIEKGFESPVAKRCVKDASVTSPKTYHCELCDLKLTSVMHANQHYTGRKHKLVANKISKPSGAGYYNSVGKWVRTATKLSVASTELLNIKSSQIITTDNRFGIGKAFKNETATNNSTSTLISTVTTTKSTKTSNSSANISTSIGLQSISGNAINNDEQPLVCKICNINVTSASQMSMHLSGSKHRKKLANSITSLTMATTEIVDNDGNTTNIIINENYQNLLIKNLTNENSDLSMYRTPTGSYYCKICDVSMPHMNTLQQHLLGKKHLAAEEKLKRY